MGNQKSKGWWPWFLIAFSLSAIVCYVQITLYGNAIIRNEPRMVAFTIVQLIVLAIAFAHAVLTCAANLHGLGHGARLFAPQRIHRKVVQATWLAVTCLAIFLWPRSAVPNSDFYAKVLFWAVVFGLPFAISESPLASKSLLRIVGIYGRLLKTLAIGLAIVSAVIFVIAKRPSIGFVDFFYYVSIAREMIEFPQYVDIETHYPYFPGVYMFWRTAIRITGGSIDSLQWCYLFVLLANSALVVAIVARIGRSYAAAFFAGVWYLVLCSRFEGFLGATEPIASLFLLAGLLIWSGVPFRGKPGAVRVVAIGTAFGLALFCKQTAGLYSLGALSFLVNYLIVRDERRHQFSQLVLIPVVAVAVATIGFALEGNGIRVFQRGIRLVAAYESRGDFPSNLIAVHRHDESATLIGGILIAVWSTLLIGTWRWKFIGQRWFEVVGFCVIAGLAPLLQFQRRAYGHYALLTAPVLVIGAVILWTQIVPKLARKRRTAWFVLSLFALIPLTSAYDNPRTLRAWLLQKPEAEVLWHNNPKVAKDLKQLQGVIPPGSTMFTVPSWCISPRYLLKTRHHPYSYLNQDVQEIPWRRFEFVLLLSDEYLSDFVIRYWPPKKRLEAKKLLQELGYEPEIELETMTVFRRR